MYQVAIVEDDAMVARLHRAFIQKDSRFRVEQILPDGRAALRWLQSHPVDLLILDVYMPGLTGLELLHRLRTQGVEADVIMVTAANDVKTVNSLLKLGVVDYLVKPFTYERFQRALDVFCQYRETVAGNALTQHALDRLFVSGGSSPDAAAPPKGLQQDTLALIRAGLTDAPSAGITGDALARQIGLSAVTVRRYLHYLEQTGEVVSTVNYDTGGRPSHLYRLFRSNRK